MPIAFSCPLHVMHLQRCSSTRGSTEAVVRLSDAYTAAVPYMDYWYVFVVLSKFEVAVQKHNYSCCNCCTALLITFYWSNILLLPGVPKYFSTPHIDLFNFDPPDRRGWGYLTPPSPSNVIPASI